MGREDDMRPALMELIEGLAEEQRRDVTDVLNEASSILRAEVEARGFLKVKRVSPNTVSIEMEGIGGQRERYSVTERPGYVGISLSINGRRPQGVRQNTAEWNKVMRVYREHVTPI